MSYRAIAILTLPLLLLGLSGCGGSAGVSGKVTYDGNPVEDGYITFAPKDDMGQKVGAKIENGRYVVKDILPGPKVVSISANKAGQKPLSTEDLARQAEERKKGTAAPVESPELIPADAEGNNKEVEV